jgi:hypothetical protein
MIKRMICMAVVLTACSEPAPAPQADAQQAPPTDPQQIERSCHDYALPAPEQVSACTTLIGLYGESRTFSFYYPKTRPGSERYTIVSSTNAHWADWAELDEASYAREKARLTRTGGRCPTHGVLLRFDHFRICGICFGKSNIFHNATMK